MTTKVAINGFGRIGRLVARAILERTDHDLELVVINDLADPKSNALLFGFDSTHGRFPGTVTSDGDSIQVNGRDILPPMPWFNLKELSDADLKAMWAYLRSIPPVKNQVPLPLLPSGTEQKKSG